AWNRRKAVRHQNRRGAGGIEQEKTLASFPGTLFRQAQVDAVFAQRQPNETRMRAERMVIKRVHEILELKSRPEEPSKPCHANRDTSQASARDNGVLAFFCDCDGEGNRREGRGFSRQNGPPA